MDGSARKAMATGKIHRLICKHRVEEIEDRTERLVRRLDKLVDELAKGRPMEKILREKSGRESVGPEAPEGLGHRIDGFHRAPGHVRCDLRAP